MAVFNGENSIESSIESILSQSFGDFEFIVVDDGSTDGTVDKIVQYTDPRIFLIQNHRNIGLTRCLNIAIKKAGGALLARQDADDVSLPSRFDRQVRFLGKNPDVVLLGTGTRYLDADGNVIGKASVPSDPAKELLKRNPFIHGSIMLRRWVALDLGGYDEFFRYCQDYELWGRIARDYRVAILPECLYLFRQHIDNTRFRNGYESSLYQLLSKKLAGDAISKEAVSDIKATGINRLVRYLERSELAFHHRAVAHMSMRTRKIENAKKEYKAALKADPFDMHNILNFALVYCGQSTWDAFHKF